METISSSRDIDAVFRHGRRTRTRTIVVLSRATPLDRDPDGRVVYVAGKRLGNAVLRNRCKRVLRGAVQRTGVAWPGTDVALIATAETADAPAEQVEQDLRAGVSEAVGLQ